jgi:hypothetical protein
VGNSGPVFLPLSIFGSGLAALVCQVMTSTAPPLRTTRARAVRQVDALDVEREEIADADRAFTGQAPERPVAQRDVVAGEQLVDVGADVCARRR